MGTQTLPPQYEWFQEQIAGHHGSVIKNGVQQIGVVKERGTPLILKPVQEGHRGTSEVGFYELLFPSSTHHVHDDDEQEENQLRSLVPEYFGTTTILVGEQSHRFLQLEDITERFSRPCIIDIKIGAVTSDPVASDEKALSEASKYPPQTTLGFRYLGYRIHVGDAQVIRDKVWGRGLEPDHIRQATLDYLAGRMNEGEAVLNMMLQRIERVREWFENQQRWRFFSSSLLIVYEGDSQLPLSVDVRMIDFSHVFDADGQLDHNYLFGLRNLLTFLHQTYK